LDLLLRENVRASSCVEEIVTEHQAAISPWLLFGECGEKNLHMLSYKMNYFRQEVSYTALQLPMMCSSLRVKQ
jgi:hypothetical protein